MKKGRRRRERAVLKTLFGGAAAVVVLGVAIFWGHKVYQKAQAKRFAQRAETYLSWGDLKSATLTARQVLEFEPSNVNGERVLAEVMERENVSTGAIEWRKKIVEEHPDSIKDAVALAKTALKFGSPQLAETTLQNIGGKAQDNPTYHETLGQLAFARGDFAAGETHFANALRLEPQNRTMQLELGTVQLRSPNSETQRQAEQNLEGLVADPVVRVTATKALLQNAVLHKDPKLVHFAEVLFDLPETPFADRLVCLQIFQRLQLPGFAASLAQAQEKAKNNPEDLAHLLGWMSSNNLSLLGLEWTNRLPPDVVRKRPVYVSVADCYLAAKDCAGLKQWCGKGTWNELEFLRHAYLARAARDCDDFINGDLEWSKAVKGGSTPEQLETLQRVASKWGWKKESIELLWQLSNNPDKQQASLGTLYQYYGEEADTGNLYRVAARLARLLPNDVQIQNNFAQLSLLLNLDVERARTLAQQLYRNHQTEPNVASTYAYALLTEGKKGEAIRIMNALREEDLKRPEIAAYYGVVLSAGGAHDKAQEFLELSRGARLLPEEKKLIDDAVARR